MREGNLSLLTRQISTVMLNLPDIFKKVKNKSAADSEGLEFRKIKSKGLSVNVFLAEPECGLEILEHIVKEIN
jgi:hypothetical protein